VLSEQLPDLSRSRLQSLIRQGRVRLDGRVAVKVSQAVQGGEAVELTIPPPLPSELVPESIPLEVVFENQDLLLVNKPAGMVVHPSPGHVSGTLVHAALAHAPDLLGIGDELRPGVVHRLDKGTSGLIVLAKHEAALRELQRQFKSREVEKAYLALVEGRPPTPAGRVEAAIGRDPSHRRRMAVVAASRGRAAATLYSTREQFAEFTLLEARPITGRTHQVRLHLAYLGCPIVGDPVYGRRKPHLDLPRPFLHAWRLAFRLPGEDQRREFEAPLPPDLEATLRMLRSDAPWTG
jgi:23S rRNA pseudouridine1911/1915/1917 synthase